jgi:flagellar basal body rod protein FlgF
MAKKPKTIQVEPGNKNSVYGGKKMKKLFSLLIGAVSVILLLVSCVIPEKFTCDINVTKNGTYSVKAQGNLVYYTVFDEIKEQGKVSEKTDSDIKSFFDGVIKEEPAITKYQYQKNGRAYIEYFKEVNDGSSVDLSSSGLPLTISVDQDGYIIVKTSAVTNDNKEKLEEFAKYGYKLDGKVTITSELPIIDTGGQKVGNKYFFFGPKVINRAVTMTTLPAEDVVVKIGKE